MKFAKECSFFNFKGFCQWCTNQKNKTKTYHIEIKQTLPHMQLCCDRSLVKDFWISIRTDERGSADIFPKPAQLGEQDTSRKFCFLPAAACTPMLSGLRSLWTSSIQHCDIWGEADPSNLWRWLLQHPCCRAWAEYSVSVIPTLCLLGHFGPGVGL